MKTIVEIYSDLAKENPPWTREEEAEAIKKWYRKDRERFLDEAMKHNLGLVFAMVQRYAFKKWDDDVVQKAVLALVDALRKFKPTKKCKISTWVTNPIRWAIQQHQHAYSKEGSIADEISALNHKNKGNLRVVSVDLDARKCDDGPDNLKIGDTITATNVAPDYARLCGLDKGDAQHVAMHDAEVYDGIEALKELLPTILTKKEVRVVQWLLKGHNKAQIAVKMKLSRMRITQISASAFEKIRKSRLATHLRTLI